MAPSVTPIGGGRERGPIKHICAPPNVRFRIPDHARNGHPGCVTPARGVHCGFPRAIDQNLSARGPIPGGPDFVQYPRMAAAERKQDVSRTRSTPGLGSSPDSRDTDEALFLRFRDQSDDEAFRALIDRYHDDLLRFLYRMLSDRQAAEDVFQEAFLQAHLSGGTFDGTRKFRPWFFTIAANKARDLLR